jgi:LPS sulfotransferase NodH
LAYLEGHARLAQLKGTTTWGFKLLAHHIRWNPRDYGEDFLGELAQRGWRFLTLQRRDLLAAVLSGLHAQHTQQWHFRTDDATAFEQMSFEPAEVIAWLHENDRLDRWLTEVMRDVPQLRLTYEDDLRDASAHQRTLDTVCEFLGVPRSVASTCIKPIAPENPWSRVINADELASALAATRFAYLCSG